MVINLRGWVLLDVEADGVGGAGFEVENSVGSLGGSVGGWRLTHAHHTPTMLTTPPPLHLDGAVQLAPQYRPLLRHHVVVRALRPRINSLVYNLQGFRVWGLGFGI